MPVSPDERLQWARAHYDAAHDLFELGRHYGWAVTALFYSGMHMVIAALPTVPGLTVAQQNPENHAGTVPGAEGTSVIVRRNVPEIRIQYRALESASRDARYYGATSSRAEVRKHRQTDLAVIAEWVCRQLHPERCDCWLTTIRSGWR